MPCLDKISTQNEYKEALKGNEYLDKKFVKFGELNELTYERFDILNQYQFLCWLDCVWISKECEK